MNKVKPPFVGDVWHDFRKKMGVRLVNILDDGGHVQAKWEPPIDPFGTADFNSYVAYVYRFRIGWHERAQEWWFDGMGPEERGWLPVEGPLDMPSPIDQAMINLTEALILALKRERDGGIPLVKK